MHVCRPFEPPPDYPLEHTVPVAPSMLRSRQFPEVPGLSFEDKNPTLRRYSRKNQSVLGVDDHRIPTSQFGWTLRPLPPRVGNLSFRVSDGRSRSEVDCRRRANSGRGEVLFHDRPAADRPTPARPPPADQPTANRPPPEPPSVYHVPLRQRTDYSSTRGSSSRSLLRKSCPDLEEAFERATVIPTEKAGQRRTRRARQKKENAEWMGKQLQDWTLDDVLLWLQHIGQHEVASFLIGYDIRGSDLLKWNDDILASLGVADPQQRCIILNRLSELREGKPKEGRITLFDIIRNTSGDQVLVVETPLTARDISVSRTNAGCLCVTRVNGVNVPLREDDCLLEINDRPGEVFKSALMLTKLITESNGEPIRFVVLRRKTIDVKVDGSTRDSSSGVSSSSPTESSLII